MDKYICLQPLVETSADAVENAVLDRLCRDLPSLFGLVCRVSPAMPLPSDAFLPIRGQYLAAEILAELRNARCTGAERVLAITNSDLCAEGLNFVFGQAELGGRLAVISTHRLRASTSRGDGRQFYRRVLKEAIHELGHTFGIGHCPDERCIMHFSNNLEDTDLKGPGFCSDCLARLNGHASKATFR